MPEIIVQAGPADRPQVGGRVRRRVRFTGEDVFDATTRQHHNIDPDDPSGDSPDPVLRDDAVWGRLRAAQQELRDAERAVREASVREPLDDVERECAEEMHRMLNRRDGGRVDWNRWHELEDRLRAHAAERSE